MEELKKKKRRVWYSLACLLCIPYPLLLLVGVLTNYYPDLYAYTDWILYGFLGLIALFTVLLIRTVKSYQMEKQRIQK